MDFTFIAYQHLLASFQLQAYAFQTFESFIQHPVSRTVIVRHDIDKLPVNALKMARLEYKLGVKASYYFRALPISFDEQVLKQIRDLGHEIGYHYEDLNMSDGDPEKAIKHFEEQLARFRQYYPVKTICMHGSPLSRHDNRDLWKYFDYHDFGIIGEPYFNVDFNQVFYVTDTGRKWNNERASVRDKVEGGFDIRIKNTFHLIELAGKGALPEKVMLTVHPQRWNNFGFSWVKELVGQNVKNVAKLLLVKVKNG